MVQFQIDYEQNLIMRRYCSALTRLAIQLNRLMHVWVRQAHTHALKHKGQSVWNRVQRKAREAWGCSDSGAAGRPSCSFPPPAPLHRKHAVYRRVCAPSTLCSTFTRQTRAVSRDSVLRFCCCCSYGVEKLSLRFVSILKVTARFDFSFFLLAVVRSQLH